MTVLMEISNKFQKSNITYRELLSKNVLDDICQKTTGQKKYRVKFIDEVNVGRLLTMKYEGKVNYVTLSEIDFKKGRNSAMQSAASALTRYFLDNSKNKKLYFYFLDFIGNAKTDYLVFVYRLLKTSGVEFINDADKIGISIKPFNSMNDILMTRGYMKKRQNFSSYITKNDKNEIEVYAKTYGANKKEATMLCAAMAKIDSSSMVVYQVKEKNLDKLPGPDRNVMNKLGVHLEQIDEEITRTTGKGKSLRSKIFTYNMLRVRGAKKCAWCDCDVPQIIEGAHIWPVYEIIKSPLDGESKRIAATDGNNGIWLCRNHHKLFDEDIVYIDTKSLNLQLNSSFNGYSYIQNSIKVGDASDYIDNKETKQYLEKRYGLIN
ncbi:hypothetical protein AKUH3B101J_10580 [Apilactobacillus kunkeei]|nr:hypothetical protein AKUH3B104J_10580 [Apilactobacillus kunkeei]CAI2630794.1 hypothetical protein AKUH3B101J_10580 [Apilactobacillus kunkeei]